jgi:protein-L-isoaspartate(D-aspartate) O-methyltransferase
VHVGAGSGYYTSILAALVGSAGSVVAVEIEPDLCVWAASNLKSFRNVIVVRGQEAGWKMPSADVIYVNAGATSPQLSWLEALVVGGRLMFPLTDLSGKGVMILIQRLSDRKYSARALIPVGFIPCAGGHDPIEGRRVSEALKRGGYKDVRSLQLGQGSDSTAWLVGEGWWLSSAMP